MLPGTTPALSGTVSISIGPESCMLVQPLSMYCKLRRTSVGCTLARRKMG
jgi:hypothetical protein